MSLNAFVEFISWLAVITISLIEGSLLALSILLISEHYRKVKK